MILIASPYRALLADLAAGGLTGATVIDALLATSAYVFDDTLAAVADLVAGQEVADAGYARFAAGAVFSVSAVGAEMQYVSLSPAVDFGSFACTDWRYVVLFNHTSGAPYLCLDSGQTNVTSGTVALTLDPGAEPYLRLVPG